MFHRPAETIRIEKNQDVRARIFRRRVCRQLPLVLVSEEKNIVSENLKWMSAIHPCKRAQRYEATCKNVVRCLLVSHATWLRGKNADAIIARWERAQARREARG
jgi:hypothetical protein